MLLLPFRTAAAMLIAMTALVVLDILVPVFVLLWERDEMPS